MTRSMSATLSQKRFQIKIYNKRLRITLFHHTQGFGDMGNLFHPVLEKVCEEKEIEVAKHVCEEDGDSDTE